jgi:hypothetical protein
MEHWDSDWTEPSFGEKFRLVFYIFIVLLTMAVLAVFFIGPEGILRMIGLKDDTLNLTLTIETVPSDVHLHINNVLIDNPVQGPVSWQRGSNYRIDASHPSCLPEYILISIPPASDAEPLIQPGSDAVDAILKPDSLHIRFDMRPEYIKIPIESKPSGASIEIDGINTGKTTPMEYEFKTGQTVTIIASKSQFEQAEKAFQIPYVPPEKPFVLELKRKTAPSPVEQPTPRPAPTGSLRVNSDFPVDVYHGSRKIVSGKKQATVSLAAGQQTLRFVNTAFLLDDVKKITISANRSQTVSIDPPGTVLLESAPPGAIVEVDGNIIGRAPGTFELYPGLYDMRFRFEQCDEEPSIWVRVVSGQIRRIPAVRGCQ